MIPADVLSRIQIAADMALLPVASSQEITEKLSDLVPGQRLMAEIQALLPNGTYRAIINQRDVTLALPFSAKSGDALELEVVQTEGKLTLAVTSRPTTSAADPSITESTSTTLSRTGQLIATLLTRTGEKQSEPAPIVLNNSQPIARTPPQTAQELIPLLKQALTQSGMFYESHQAQWVDGQRDLSTLRQEPQGKLPVLTSAYQMPGVAAPTLSSSTMFTATPQSTALPENATHVPIQNLIQNENPQHRAQNLPPNTSHAQHPTLVTSNPYTAATINDATASQNTSNESNGTRSTLPASAPNPSIVSPDVAPLVQQQLEALATHHFSWQGQIWPGQMMRWDITEEIDEEAARRGQSEDKTDNRWQTRLRLMLPHLGELDAQLRLNGTQISLAVKASDTQTQDLLRSATPALRKQLDTAGLMLASIGIGTADDGETNEQIKS